MNRAIIDSAGYRVIGLTIGRQAIGARHAQTGFPRVVANDATPGGRPDVDRDRFDRQSLQLQLS